MGRRPVTVTSLSGHQPLVGRERELALLRAVVAAERGTVGEVERQAASGVAGLRFVGVFAVRQPHVLPRDDAHWMDAGSRGRLRFVARAASTGPLLLLATYRSDELARR